MSTVWKYEKPNYEMLFKKIDKLQKELDNSISKDKIREYIKENKRVYEMQTPNRNRVVYKDCVLLTSEAKELLGE